MSIDTLDSQAALKGLLEAAFPPVFSSDPEPEQIIKRIAGSIERGLTRVYAVNVDECTWAGQCKDLLEKIRSRIEDPESIHRLAEILEKPAEQKDSQKELFASVFANIAFEKIDRMLQQVEALGRQENVLYIKCLRVGGELIILVDRDSRYDWVLPAVQKRLREELSHLHYEPTAIESQSLDLTCGHRLRFLDFELRLIKDRHGDSRVRYRLVDKAKRRQAQKTRSRRLGRYQPPRFLQPCLNWIARIGKANAIQVGWRHLPITLFPILMLLFGWGSLLPWLDLGLIFACNWHWPLGLLRWSGRHKLDVVMGACAVAALICLSPLLRDIYANRSREVAASSSLPPGFYLGEHHGSSWWNGEPAPAVHYGLYLPPHLQGRKGPFPLIVFLHGYGERTKTRLFKAGLPRAIAQRFGTNKPNGQLEFVAFFPIDPTGRWQAGSDEVERVMMALDYVIGRHRIDPSRVYLTGLSAGGSGVWELAQAYPDRWAAVAPVCSFISPDVEKVKHLPAWIFHGAKDEQAPVNRERYLVQQLEEAKADVRYTEFSDKGHGIWPEVYNPKEFYKWLASKKKD